MLEEESMLPVVLRLGGRGAAASHSRGTCIRCFGQTSTTALKQKPCRGRIPLRHSVSFQCLVTLHISSSSPYYLFYPTSSKSAVSAQLSVGPQ